MYKRQVQTRRIQVIPKYKRDTSCVDELNLKVPTEWAGVISNYRHGGLELSRGTNSVDSSYPKVQARYKLCG